VDGAFKFLGVFVRWRLERTGCFRRITVKQTAENGGRLDKKQFEQRTVNFKAIAQFVRWPKPKRALETGFNSRILGIRATDKIRAMIKTHYTGQELHAASLQRRQHSQLNRSADLYILERTTNDSRDRNIQ